MPEHAVIIHLSLGTDLSVDTAGFGTQQARNQVRALARDIEAALDGRDTGELDGDAFGAGEAIVFLYGRDADRLFAAVEPSLRNCALRPAHAVLRYGEADDPTARERRVDL